MTLPFACFLPHLHFLFLLLLLRATPTLPLNYTFDLTKHFCARLMLGRLEAITFASLTSFVPWKDGRYEAFHIYEPGDRLYRMPLARLSADHLNLTGIGYQPWSAEKPLGVSSLPSTHAPLKPRAVYILHMGVSVWQKASGGIRCILANYILTESKNYLLLKYDNIGGVGAAKWQDGVYWKERATAKVPFTLITNQKAPCGGLNGDTKVTLYGISQDPTSGHFIIYQIQTDWYFAMAEIPKPKGASPHGSQAKVYFLEKTEHADELRLARPGSHRPEVRYQLFSSGRGLPHGYLLHGTGDLVFWDTKRGCVYRIEGWKERNLLAKQEDEDDERGSWTFKRVNIPFEVFFQCDSRFYQSKVDFKARFGANRCDHTSIDEKLPPGEREKENQGPLESLLKNPLLWAIAGLGILICVLLLLLFNGATLKAGKHRRKDKKALGGGKKKSKPKGVGVTSSPAKSSKSGGGGSSGTSTGKT